MTLFIITRIFYVFQTFSLIVLFLRLFLGIVNLVLSSVIRINHLQAGTSINVIHATLTTNSVVYNVKQSQIFQRAKTNSTCIKDIKECNRLHTHDSKRIYFGFFFLSFGNI